MQRGAADENKTTINKRNDKSKASSTIGGTLLENVENIKYLSVTFKNDLKHKAHIINICAKANIPLGFLRQYMRDL